MISTKAFYINRRSQDKASKETIFNRPNTCSCEFSFVFFNPLISTKPKKKIISTCQYWPSKEDAHHLETHHNPPSAPITFVFNSDNRESLINLKKIRGHKSYK